jgi:hypothetical protein
MSEVQVTCDWSYAELRMARSDRGCAGPAIDSGKENDREPSISHLGNAHRYFGSGLESLRYALEARLQRSCQLQRAEMGIAAASRQRADVAASCPSADIFEESRMASAGDRGSSRLIVPWCAIAQDPRAKNAGLRRPDNSERGLKLCR